MDQAGIFHGLPYVNDARLAKILAREVLMLLVDRGLPSSERVERIHSWRDTGFNVCSRVRVRTEAETERIGKYLVRPVPALDRLSFFGGEDQVGYRCGDQGPSSSGRKIWSSSPGPRATSPIKARLWSDTTGCMPTLEFIRHLSLRLVAEKPPLSLAFEQIDLMAVEESRKHE